MCHLVSTPCRGIIHAEYIICRYGWQHSFRRRLLHPAPLGIPRRKTESQNPSKSAITSCRRPYSTPKSTMNPFRIRVQDGYSAPLNTALETVEQWISLSIGKPGKNVVDTLPTHPLTRPPTATDDAKGTTTGAAAMAAPPIALPATVPSMVVTVAASSPELTTEAAKEEATAPAASPA